jgi:predicted Zn-dependent protease
MRVSRTVGPFLFTLVLALSPVLCSTDSRSEAGDPTPHICDIYFVPLGPITFPSPRELTIYYRQKLGLTIHILPSLPIEPVVLDRVRRQVIGEELIALMKRKYPHLVKDSSVLLIGLTKSDMYIRSKDWRFAFAIRQEGRYVVASTYRMDPVNFGEFPDPRLLATRLRKVITKQLGLYLYGLSQREGRTSVLFGPILSLGDLDGISEDFDAEDLAAMANRSPRCRI